MNIAFPAPAQRPRHITHFAFRMRMTQGEREALEIAQLDNPSAAMADRVAAARVRSAVKDWDSSTFVDLDLPELRIGLLRLEAAGILGANRADEILDLPVDDRERP